MSATPFLLKEVWEIQEQEQIELKKGVLSIANASWDLEGQMIVDHKTAVVLFPNTSPPLGMQKWLT